MQIISEHGKGDSIDNPIIIDAKDAISGVILEHSYIDQFIDSLDCDIESIEQNLVFEDGRQLDQVRMSFEGGTEKVLFFDVTSFYGKM